MRTASRFLSFFGATALSIRASAGTLDTEARLREVEATLLHKQLSFVGVSLWNTATKTWRPLSVPPAKVYVVNLWSVHCQPCIAEMPQLARIVRGWAKNREVQFLFIADPPRETEAEELEHFWQNPPVELPEVMPERSTTERIRNILGVTTEPLTLLLDENLIVRQAFAGTIGTRSLGTAIERLLSAVRGTARDGSGRLDRR